MLIRIVIVILLSTTALAHRAILSAQASAGQDASTGAVSLPPRIGAFHQEGPDVEIAPHVKSLLETSNILIRTYVSPEGVPVEVAIVNSGTSRRSLHFPEVCITGAGWEIREQGVAPVGLSFMAKRLVIFKGDELRASMYWFKTGDTFTESYLMNSLTWIRGQVLLQPQTSMMIRVSAPIGPAGNEAAFRVLDSFANSIAPVLLEQD